MGLMREKEIQTLLQRALKFTGEDLQANRAGEMTETQKNALRQERFWTIISYAIVGIILAALLSRPLMALLAGLYIAPIVFLVTGGSLWSYYHLKRAIEENAVESVTGIVRRSIEFDTVYRRRRSRMNAKYQILIADEIFDVEKPVHDAFIESETYTIYYIPSLDRIVSGEMTFAADHFPQHKLRRKISL